MGRVNRKGEQKQPAPVHLLAQYDPRSEYLYGKPLLEKTLTLLNRLPPEPTNRDLCEASDQLYEELWGTEPFQKELQEGEQALKEVQQICGCYTIDLNDEQMRRRFATRKGEIQIVVLPEQFLQEAYQLREQKQLWRLPELLVPVPYWWLLRFSERFYLARDLGVPITTLPYDDQIGLHHPLSELEAPSADGEWII
jgi:CRISPR-associated endonuclease/helicase Cas3